MSQEAHENTLPQELESSASMPTPSTALLRGLGGIIFVDATPVGEASTHTKKSRNLVVCIDGTANKFGPKNTHVAELYSQLVADDTQFTYYGTGIGASIPESSYFARAMNWFGNTLDMAVARHHKRTTLKAYRWLSERYVPGDRIYLFGFSRGAYQVRIIAGMIKVIGLPREAETKQIPFGYKLYLAMMKVEMDAGGQKAEHPKPSKVQERGEVMVEKDRDVMEPAENQSKVHPHREGKVEERTKTKDERHVEDEVKQSEQTRFRDPKSLCDQFKQRFCHPDIIVHFVGVWDTVSSIGVTRGTSFPHTTDGMLHVRALRHALSLHELRSKFLPEYANGGGGPLEGGNVKEVWFAGAHSDIGGGNTKNTDANHFGPALKWMLYEALEHGLLVKPYRFAWGGPVHHPSMTLGWRIFEVYPWKRLAYDGENPTAVKRWPPHMSGGRRVQPRQLIHESAFEYLRDKSSSDKTKAKIRHEGSWVLIQDIYDSDVLYREENSNPRDIVDIIQQANARGPHDPLTDTLLQQIQVLVTSATGPQALIDCLDSLNTNGVNSLLDVLQQTSSRQQSEDMLPVGQANTANALCIILAQLRLRPRGCNIRPGIYRWLRFADSDSKTRAQVLRTFGTINGHTNVVLSVAYSPDGTCIVSGSSDGTVRLWSATSGNPIGEPLLKYEGAAYSVAWSLDGTLIVSGLGDTTIRVWSATTHQVVGEPLTGHEGNVLSVAFSPNGKSIASGSDDNTVRIWETATGQVVGEPLRGHSHRVMSVAFSPDPDGKHVASGSVDKTIRIWDAKTHDTVTVLQGHFTAVHSIVFSPDCTGRIISGSGDNTIMVWDTGTGEVVLGPLPRRRSESGSGVLAIAVSPNGRYIVSGLYNGAVELWNTQTGGRVGEPLKGHIDSVTSVSFSPNGQWIVSSSGDSKIMIWEV